MVKLNSKGALARFYNWTHCNWYGDLALPKSLCVFFWSLVLSVLILPFTIFTIWIPHSAVDGIGERTWLGFLHILVLGVLVGFGFLVYYNPVQAAAMALLVGGFALSMFAVAGIKGLRNNMPEFIKESFSVTKETAKGFLDRHCPRIQWK